MRPRSKRKWGEAPLAVIPSPRPIVSARSWGRCCSGCEMHVAALRTMAGWYATVTDVATIIDALPGSSKPASSSHSERPHAMATVKYNGGGNYNDISMGSNHSGGCNVAFGDASVRFLQESIDLNRVLLPLASRNGGEVVQEF